MASVRIGGYSLEVATHGGSFARFEPSEESENAQELAAALEEQPEEPGAAAAAIRELEASAEVVTGRIEEAEELLRSAAEGTLLDPASLSGKIDPLLDLLARLDKDGRFEEELALMRSLNGLLALCFRWLELVRSLRSLLASAEAAGHKAGQALAHHELGSLHLCAGNAEEAERHLGEALRIEEQLGDLAGRCATRHNLDAARRERVAPRDGLTPPRRLLRLAALAAVFAGLGAGLTGIAFAVRDDDDGPGPGERTSVAFTVEQDFEPDTPRASVNVSVRCTEGGAPDASPRTAREGAPAVFAISDFGTDATCTATARDAPARYTTDESDCLNVPIAGSDSPSCTITSSRETAGSATFTVTKDFEPGNRAFVSVSVTCTSGRPRASPMRAREGSPAVFVIRGLLPGATCTATESAAPAGYRSREDACRRVPIVSTEAAACTIVNTRDTPDSVRFTVAKDFEPDDPERSVSISLECTDGQVDSPQPATETRSAVFTITGFGAGSTCTATEGPAPEGYTSDEGDCNTVAIADTPACTITNRLNSTTFSIHPDFTDDSARGVAFSLSCDSGTVDPPSETAREGSPAEFEVTGFTAGAACSATTIRVASGYRHDDTACQSVPVDARECTIVFEPPG